MNNKYVLEIGTNKKKYKLVRGGLIHRAYQVMKVLSVISVAFLVSYGILFSMSYGVDDCFEKNSHLTHREQKAICTID